MLLPIDEVEMERAIATSIRDIIASVPHVAHAYVEPLFANEGKEDEILTTMNDPVVGNKSKVTNVAQVGIPTCGENAYSGAPDVCTMLTFHYPITFNLGIVANWPLPEGDPFPYRSSAQMVIGIHMRARKLFKQFRTLKFERTPLTPTVEHGYLQLDYVNEVMNEEGEALEFELGWSLRVTVKGVMN